MLSLSFFFFFNDTATTEIYTLSLHDALPIFRGRHHARRDRLDRRWSTHQRRGNRPARRAGGGRHARDRLAGSGRSEEHTSELQSPFKFVCRLLPVKKKISTCAVYSGGCVAEI